LSHAPLRSFPTRRSSDLELLADRQSEQYPRPTAVVRCSLPEGAEELDVGPDVERIPDPVRDGQSQRRPIDAGAGGVRRVRAEIQDRKSTRLNSSHVEMSY